jgi:hypothetical protein
MTPELVSIRAEIEALNDRWADLNMLTALANNIVFSLGRIQDQPETAPLTARQKNNLNNAMTDVLNTLNKEISWAQELDEHDPERQTWFKKAKNQILEDIQGLFEA